VIVSQDNRGGITEQGSLEDFAGVHDCRVQTATAHLVVSNDLVPCRKAEDAEGLHGLIAEERTEYRGALPSVANGVWGDDWVTEDIGANCVPDGEFAKLKNRRLHLRLPRGVGVPLQPRNPTPAQGVAAPALVEAGGDCSGRDRFAWHGRRSRVPLRAVGRSLCGNERRRRQPRRLAHGKA
jgi:hypothetical protein